MSVDVTLGRTDLWRRAGAGVHVLAATVTATLRGAQHSREDEGVDVGHVEVIGRHSVRHRVGGHVLGPLSCQTHLQARARPWRGAELAGRCPQGSLYHCLLPNPCLHKASTQAAQVAMQCLPPCLPQLEPSIAGPRTTRTEGTADAHLQTRICRCVLTMSSGSTSTGS